MPAHIVIASADADIRGALAEQLTSAGYACSQAASGKAYREMRSAQAVDAAISDSSLPDIADAEITLGLNLPKPVRLSMLLAQLAEAVAPKEIPMGRAVFLPRERMLSHVALTEKETALLLLLHQQKEVERDTLLKSVWGYGDDITTHTLETHMYRLRAKLAEALGVGEWIVTTESGYRLAL